MSVTLTKPVSRPLRLPATPAAPVQGAIADAREGCPYDATWDAVGWNDLYGD